MQRSCGCAFSLGEGGGAIALIPQLQEGYAL